MRLGTLVERPASVCSTASSEMSDDSPLPSPAPAASGDLMDASEAGTTPGGGAWSSAPTSPTWSRTAVDVDEAAVTVSDDDSPVSPTCWHFPPNPYRRNQSGSWRSWRRADSPTTPGGKRQRCRVVHCSSSSSLDSPPSTCVVTSTGEATRLSDERRCLDKAVLGGDPQQAERVLASSAAARLQLDRLDADGFAPLHRAAQVGNLPLLQVLVARGANHRLANRDGFNALHLAAGYGHLHIVHYLLRL